MGTTTVPADELVQHAWPAAPLVGERTGHNIGEAALEIPQLVGRRTALAHLCGGYDWFGGRRRLQWHDDDHLI